MKTPKSFFPLPLLLGSFLHAAPPESAPVPTSPPLPAPQPLDAIVVTASRSDSTVFDSPFSTHSVSRSDFIDRRQVRDLAEALRETPGVLLQRTAYGQASPFIRGFTGFRTLTLIDGIRLNNAVFREGPNQYFSTIDPFTVDRVEIVKGPSSVLYGSDAIGGTVNLLTRNPSVPQENAPLLLQPGAFYRFASAENSHTARGDFSAATGPNSGILGGVTWRDSGDIRGGSTIGQQPNTGFAEINGDVKWVFHPNRDVDLSAAFYRTEQNNVPRTHSTVFAKSFDGTTVGTDLRRDLDQRRELSYFQAEVRDPIAGIEKINASLSWHRQAEEQDRIRSSGQREIAGFQDDQFGVLLSAVSPSPLGKLTYGSEYYHDAVQSHGSQWNPDGSLRQILPRGPVADDSHSDQLGVYLQDEIRVCDPLTVFLGGRYSYANVRTGTVDPDPADKTPIGSLSDSWSAFTGSARFRLDLTPDWNLFGGVSQGFRAPNLSDLTAFDISRSGEREVPSPGLDPEYYTSFEIGTKTRIQGVHLTASYFHTLVEDQISRFPTGQTLEGEPVVQRANLGDGFIHGVELGAHCPLPKGFTAFGNLTWTEGRIDAVSDSGLSAQPASRIQPLTGLIGLRWSSPQGGLWLETTAELARHQDRLSPGDLKDTQRIPPGGTRGYQVYAVRAGWKPTDRIQLLAAVENFTHEDYRLLGSGTNELGTNVILSTRLQF
jgi:hemoglobin/transferrin/lactoferrin receptor protein